MYVKLTHMKYIEIMYTGNIRVGKVFGKWLTISQFFLANKDLLADLSRISMPIVLVVIIHKIFPCLVCE